MEEEETLWILSFFYSVSTCPLSPSFFTLPPPPPSHVPSQAPRAPQWARFHLSATLIFISRCSSCFFFSPLLPSPF
ncbi:uncharacterized [Tachysurus ichikawai]